MSATRAPAWLDEVPSRPLLERGLEARFPLPPGDRSLVVARRAHRRRRGAPRAPARPPDRGAGPRPSRATARGPVAGTRWTPPPGRRRHATERDGELLAPLPGRKERWRLVTGEHRVRIESPLGGDVIEVRPGRRDPHPGRRPGDPRRVRRRARPRTGRLELATDPFGELRPGGIDVGRAGSILVVGSRIDAEALTRARAMGVRGIVVATLPGKELRDFQASERRQRASLHPTRAVRGAGARRDRPAADREPDRGDPRAHGRHARSRCSSTRRPSCSTPTRATCPCPTPTGSASAAGSTPGSRAGSSGSRRAAAVRGQRARSRRRGWRSTARPSLDVPLGDLERFT